MHRVAVVDRRARSKIRETAKEAVVEETHCMSVSSSLRRKCKPSDFPRQLPSVVLQSKPARLSPFQGPMLKALSTNQIGDEVDGVKS